MQPFYNYITHTKKLKVLIPTGDIKNNHCKIFLKICSHWWTTLER